MNGSNCLLLAYLALAWLSINLVFRILKPTHIDLVSPLHLRLTTQRLNRPLHTLANLPIMRTRLAIYLTNAFYDLGICVAIASMLLCLVLLAAAGTQIAFSLWGKWGIISQILFAAESTSNRSAGQSLQKRMPLTTVTGGSKDATRQLLQPVIPGLTMPVGHIWYYLLSLAICATIHELGHALAASFSRVPLRQFGVFIMGIYPGAFVDLEATELEKRPVIEQLRIVCAGVWHNAVTAMCIYLLVYSGAMSKFFEAAGWQKIDGVAIVEIQKTSPLFGRVPELSIIWQIDDIRLDENGKRGGSAVARWTRALTATRRNAETVEQGFCAVQAENVDDGLCCEMSPQYPMGESPDTEIFCFEPYHSSNATTGKAPVTRRKRSQLPLLTSEPQWPSICFDLRTVLERTGSLRCHTSAECPGTLPVCVLPRSPYPESRAMRIYYTTPTGSQEMTIYVGSLDRLWLDIHVSSLVPPKYDWVPKNMPAWCDALGKYLLSFSIALCLLNALPAWYLDGDHALKLLLVSGAESNKAEKKDGERVMGGQAERVHAVVTMVTTALLAWCIGGSVLLLVL